MNSKELKALLHQMNELKEHIASIERKNATPEEVFLNSDQMERLLKCSPSTLYRLRKNGSIPHIKIGGKYFYPKNYFTAEVIKIITKTDPSKKFDK